MGKRDHQFERIHVSRLKDRDRKAFSEIFSTYYKDLVYFAFSFLRDASSAEDVVQETFIKLWEECHNLEIKVSLRSYLLKTIHNRCLDIYRHKKIIDAHEEYIKIQNLIFDNDTEGYILRSEMAERIDMALAIMPENIREAYELNRNKGLKYREIALKLNVSVRTVEERISKALEILRNNLSEFI